SFAGQILVLTYPLQGNYGVGRTSDAFESSRIQVQGLVVTRASPTPNHHNCGRSLPAWLADEGIIGLEGVDTRAITQRLRARGTMRGFLVLAGLDDVALNAAKERATVIPPSELARRVAPRHVTVHEAGSTRVLFVDAGAKANIMRELLRRKLTVIQAPFT